MSGFGLGDVDLDNLDGFDRIEPGKYLVRFQNAELTDKGSYKVHYEVLTGTTPNQSGKTGNEFLSPSPKAKVRILLLHLACGLVTREQLAAMKARGEDWYPDWDALVGKECVLELEKGEKYVNVTFRGFYPPDSPEASDVPGCGPGGNTGGNGSNHGNATAHAPQSEFAAIGGGGVAANTTPF